MPAGPRRALAAPTRRPVQRRDGPDRAPGHCGAWPCWGCTPRRGTRRQPAALRSAPPKPLRLPPPRPPTRPLSPRRALRHRMPASCEPTAPRVPAGSGAGAVEMLQQVMSCELNLLVAPLRGPVLACDQAHAMDAAKVPVDERIPCLGLIGGTIGQAEMPRCVLVPRVRLQEGVLIVGLGLAGPPVAVEHVLACVDELPRPRHRALIDRVGSHQIIMPANARVLAARRSRYRRYSCRRRPAAADVTSPAGWAVVAHARTQSSSASHAGFDLRHPGLRHPAPARAGCPAGQVG